MSTLDYSFRVIFRSKWNSDTFKWHFNGCAEKKILRIGYKIDKLS